MPPAAVSSLIPLLRHCEDSVPVWRCTWEGMKGGKQGPRHELRPEAQKKRGAAALLRPLWGHAPAGSNFAVYGAKKITCATSGYSGQASMSAEQSARPCMHAHVSVARTSLARTGHSEQVAFMPRRRPTIFYFLPFFELLGCFARVFAFGLG